MAKFKNIRFGVSRSYVLDFAACVLIVLAHFVNFILYFDYTKIFPDLLVVIIVFFGGALFLAGLMQLKFRLIRPAIFSILITIVLSDVLFEFGVADDKAPILAVTVTLLISLAVIFFLREHTSKVLIGAFGAMLFSTFVLAPSSSTVKSHVNPTASKQPRSALPPVVHLVVDEHTGLEGMTGQLPGGADIRNEVRDFYNRHGFQLFAGAYSEFFNTHMSLGSMMNFTANAHPLAYLEKKRDRWLVGTNKYFEIMSARGYRINVYQSRYIDFCKSKNAKIAKCVVYNQSSLHKDVIAPLSLAERVKLLLRSYYSSFAIYKLANYIGKSHDMGLHDLGLWHGQVGPLAVMPTLEKLIGDVSVSRGGTLFFAHLLIPHYPYVYDANCRIRSPVSGWKLRYHKSETNTVNSRRQRYREYFDQIRCTMAQLAPLFTAMKTKGTFEGATILIHGDHGSRITRVDPLKKNLSKISREDFLDSYSTLFAFKTPGIQAGIDMTPLPLSRLLEFVVDKKKKHLAVPLQPSVFMDDGEGSYIKSPISQFLASPP